MNVVRRTLYVASVGVAALYNFYFLLWYVGVASPPKSSNMSPALTFLGFMIIPWLPATLVYFSDRFDLTRMEDGYSDLSSWLFLMLAAATTATLARAFYVEVIIF